jgi:class 3 adenylate cyclase
MPTTSDDYASYLPRLLLAQLAKSGPNARESTKLTAALLFTDISGFTPLTERLAREGPGGAEELSRLLNDIFGQLVGLIAAHGGDVMGFAGDAMVSLWSAEDEDLKTASLRALQCGLAVMEKLNGYRPGEGGQLHLKACVGAGDVLTGRLGGLRDSWKFATVGAPLDQIAAATHEIEPGDMLVSPEAWALVEGSCVGERLPTGAVRVRSVTKGVPQRPMVGAASWSLPAEVVRPYVPEAIVSRLDAGQSEWIAEIRRVTVLFANVIGLAHGETEGFETLQRVAQVFQSVVGRYEGTIKEIGVDDKGTVLIAGFGLPPRTHEDDALRAVRVALDLHPALQDLGVVCRIGLATGRMFCGPVGAADRRDFAMYGDPMNLAGRLMVNAPEGDVLCDEATAQALRGRLPLEKQALFILKGRLAPEPVYRALPPTAMGGTSGAFVGRVAELEALSRRLQALRDGLGGLVVVQGEPGIGKSRLLEELLRGARGIGLRTFSGSGFSMERSTPYFAWRTLVSQVLGIEGVRDEAARRGRVVAALEPFSELVRLAPLLNTLLPVDFPDNELTSQLQGEARAHSLNGLIVRLLQREAQTAPFVLVLEDGHWLDSSSWTLAAEAAREASPILTVLLTRPIPDPPPGYQELLAAPGTLVLPLEGLVAEEAAKLFSLRVGARTVADPVALVAHQRAEGNPFYIEELAHALRDGGKIVVAEGVAQAAPGIPDLGGSSIPETVQGIVSSRIDLLSPQEQLLLKMASVVGRVFSYAIIRDVHPIPEDRDRIHDSLDASLRLELIKREPGEGEETYSFRHAITQEVAYDLMLESQRSKLHGEVARWYEQAHAEDLTPYLPLLAFHWGKAAEGAGGSPEAMAKTLEYLERAGDWAIRGYSNEEAVGFFLEALRIGKKSGLDSRTMVRWEAQLGQAYGGLGDLALARQYLESSLASRNWRVPATKGQLVRALLRQAALQTLHRTFPKTIGKAADRAAVLEAARSFERLEEIYFFENDQMRTLYAALRMLNLAETAGPSGQLAIAYVGMALVGRFISLGIGLKYVTKAGETVNQVQDLYAMEQVRGGTGMFWAGEGAWSKAEAGHIEGRDISRRTSDWRRWDIFTSQLASDLFFQGRLLAGLELATEQVAEATRHRSNQGLVWGLMAQGYGHLRLGDVDRAALALGKASQVFTDFPGLQAADAADYRYMTAQLAKVNLLKGNVSRAQELASAARSATPGGPAQFFFLAEGYGAAAEVYLALAEQTTGDQSKGHMANGRFFLKGLLASARVFPIWLPRALLVKGSYQWADGKRNNAFASWKRVVESAERLAMPYEHAMALYETGRRLPPADAMRRAYLQQASEELHKLGAGAAVGLAVEAGPREA